MELFECENGRLPEGVLPHKYDRFVAFTLPEGSFRKAAVDYMRKMATFEWTPLENCGTSLNKPNWKYTHNYEKGVTYRGLPYASSNRSFGDFLKNIEENGGKFRDLTSKENAAKIHQNWWFWGVECNSSTDCAIQQFSPIANHVARQYMPSFKDEFIGILHGDVTVPEGATKTAYMIEASGEDKIFENYSLADMGDIIMHKNEDSGMCHVRMLTEKPHVEYKDGRIDPENSYLTCIEQTDSFDKTRTDGVLTTWRVDKKYPFAILLQKNYIAMTLEVYKTNKSIVPYLALDRLPKDEDLKKGRLFGIVSSDYPITYCYLKLFDKDGKQVNKVEYHERYGAFAVALAEYSDKLFCGVCPGEYKLVIEAGLHRGDATLYSGEFTYSGRE
ncbi:MAG: hypothetical protein E7615_05330 [Ruminococcaceae bacterium]|nr:hypothetical protein [Oscillospiraceae bacterium]